MTFTNSEVIHPSVIKFSRVNRHEDKLAIFLYLLTVMTTLVVAWFCLTEASLAVFLTFTICGLGGALLAVRLEKTTLYLFAFVYLGSVLCALALYFIYLRRYGLPYYGGGSDDLDYELSAAKAARLLSIWDYSVIRGTIVLQNHNSPGYVYLISLFYRFGELWDGFHTMIPRFFNAFCLGSLAALTYVLGIRLDFSRTMATRAALFVGLLPIMMFSTIHTFRDIITSLLTLLVLLIWTPRTGEPSNLSRLIRWGLTLSCCAVLSQFRVYQAVATLAIAVVADLFTLKAEWRWSQIVYLLISIVILFILAAVVFRNETLALWTSLLKEQVNYTEYRSNIAADGLSSFVFNTPPPLGYILRIGYAFISPLPIPSTDLDRLWLSIGTIIQFFFLPFLAVGLFQTLYDRKKWHIAAAFVLLFVSTAVISFTSRHMVQFMPYGALLTALGFRRLENQRFIIWLLTSILGVILAILYIQLK